MGTAGFLRRDRVLRRHRAGGVNLASDVGDDAVPGGVEDAAAMRCDQPIDDQAIGLSRAKYRLAIASDRLYRLFTVRRDFDLGGFGGKVFTKAAARSSQSRKVRTSRGGGSTKT
jgi:hypothetical protein